MKKPKFGISIILAIVALIAAITAIVIFRNEIVFFISDVKDKVKEKKWFEKGGEFADYADVE